MPNVYRVLPLEKKSISWEIEMYRTNADGSISWFNISDHYRWGQGFIEEDMDCNLPYKGDDTVYCKNDCGWGAELDDQHSCWFEYSDDISNEEKEAIETAYHEGGAGWLFDGDHEWQVEDDYIIITKPYQIDLCNEDGSVIEENIKLKTRPDPSTAWPFSESFPKPTE